MLDDLLIISVKFILWEIISRELNYFQTSLLYYSGKRW